MKLLGKCCVIYVFDRKEDRAPEIPLTLARAGAPSLSAGWPKGNDTPCISYFVTLRPNIPWSAAGRSAGRTTVLALPERPSSCNAAIYFSPSR